MKNGMKKVFWAVESILIFLVLSALTTALTKNIYASVLIENFKSQGVFCPEKSTRQVYIYEVPSEEERPCYTMMGDTILPGAAGDILLSLNSEMDIPFVKEFVSFFAGGHATIVLDDYADGDVFADEQMIAETTGLNPDCNLSVIDSKRYWASSIPYASMVGLRVRVTERERKKVISKAISLVGDPYNYLFIGNTTKTSYCSDLVSKAYASVGVNLNKDGFTTSVYDLVVSGETYISYYQYFDADGIRHIYYLA